MPKYYSQFGQDKYLIEKYYDDGAKQGIYVDIGSHDGITGSNTKTLEELDWTGMCFEPMPKAYVELCINRKCAKSNMAISSTEGESNFLAIKGYSEQLSGLVKNYSPEHVQRIHREIDEHKQTFEQIPVKCGVFNKEVKFNDIDILSIDTEGSESEILRSINYDYFKIKFIVAEFNYADYPLIDFLSAKGFAAEVRLGTDIIFRNNTISIV